MAGPADGGSAPAPASGDGPPIIPIALVIVAVLAGGIVLYGAFGDL